MAKQLRKGAVLVGDAPGFVMNRLLLRFMGEVLAAVDEGTPADVADRRWRPLGLPMTPIMLTQLSGPAVGLHVQETLHDAFGDRFPVSANLRRSSRPKRDRSRLDAEGQQYVAPETAAL